MKLDDKTRRVLENFATIQNSIRFVPGPVIATKTPGTSIVAQFRTEHPIETEFALTDLSRFLGLARLFADPEIKVSLGRLTLSEAGKRASYTLGVLDKVDAPPVKELVVKPDASFQLTAQMLKQIRDAGAVLRTEDVVVVGDKGKLSVEAASVSDPTSDKYSLVVGETDKSFRLAFDKDNIKVITTDYDVDVALKGFMRLRAGDLTYFITADSRKSVV